MASTTPSGGGVGKVPAWAGTGSGGGGGDAQVFRTTFTDAGSDNFVFNTGFGLPNNSVVTVEVRTNLFDLIYPDLVTFGAGNSVTINLASFRAANGGTIPGTWQVVMVG